MSDWTNPAHYAYTKNLTPEGWTWEFLRRNPDYRADYAEVSAAASPITKPNHLRRVADFRNGPNGQWETPAEALGRKWGLLGAIQNPSLKRVPRFLAAHLKQIQWDDVRGYFDYFNEQDAYHPKPQFVLFAFAVDKPIPPQIDSARSQLIAMQRSDTAPPLQKPPHKGQDKWPLYLQLLDGSDAGIRTIDIAKSLKHYKNLGVGTEVGQYINYVYRNLKRARKLRDDPLSILREKEN